MKILAPLRGVTVRSFRHVFSGAIVEAGFTEAITPFLSANRGMDPSKDREIMPDPAFPLRVTPQFIGKDPEALGECLKRVKDMGYATADLNAGCPFPMVRNKGRGSGLLKTPDLFRRMLEAGCETMGGGAFSVKVRLGVDSPGELEGLVPVLNDFPLRFVTIHARLARQMYEGLCDWDSFDVIAGALKAPVVRNGDLSAGAAEGMVGREFIRSLADHDGIKDLLSRYIAVSREELCGDRPVVGRMKELLGYFKDNSSWKRRWCNIKLSRTASELLSAIG